MKCPPHHTSEMAGGHGRCTHCHAHIIDGRALRRLFQLMAGGR